MKTFTLGIRTAVAAIAMVPCFQGLVAQTYYHGNSTWESKSEYFPIVEEKFSDWNYTDADGYGLKDPTVNSCAIGGNARADYIDYSTWVVERPIDARQGVDASKKFAFYLDFCQIQPDCDTQSGTNFTLYPAQPYGGDYRGASWTNVSLGCISIYDNYADVRNKAMYPGVNGDGAGSFTTSKISKLERVQYTTSAYGSKRGFHMEIGYDMGDGTVYWDTLRYIPGSSMAKFHPIAELPDKYLTNVKSFEESNRGWVFEEVFDPEMYQNVYLRIRPTNSAENRQIVRLHDFKIYGVLYTQDAGVLPPVPTSVKKGASASWLKIFGSKGQYHLNIESDVQVLNASGIVVETFSQTKDVNLSSLPSGLYILKAVSLDGKVASKTIVF